MFVLPPLPYPQNALEPVISANTLHFHHGKHHAGYVKTLNTLLSEAGIVPETLDSVTAAAHASGNRELFNAAAQTRNHSFFWEAMTPNRAQPSGELATQIAQQMSGLEALKATFVRAGVAQFGSGWVWLVVDDTGDLAVTVSHDANDWCGEPGATPLTVCDVWEHAYYLDYQNDRKAFLEAWFDTLLNWDFAEKQYAAALGRGTKWHHPLPA